MKIMNMDPHNENLGSTVRLYKKQWYTGSSQRELNSSTLRLYKKQWYTSKKKGEKKLDNGDSSKFLQKRRKVKHFIGTVRNGRSPAQKFDFKHAKIII